MSQRMQRMRTTYIFLLLGILFYFSSVSAVAQVQCAGSLDQKSFYPEIKALNVKIQKNVLEGRKLEAELSQQVGGSAETKEKEKRLAQIKSELQEQKKTFQELNSPKFPSTSLTALGAACSDFRWTDRAKDLLIKHPEKLGQHYYVWMNTGTREIKASQERPKLEEIAK
jgi:hypothetical protein